MNSRLADRLARQTQGEVRFDDASRARYATDASIYQVMPAGVFVPQTAEDVASAIAIAREEGASIVPRGAGTSQCGQTVGVGLVIDCTKHLRNVLAVNAQARTAVVEPGLVLDALNAQLRRHGLWFPVDVSTSAQATLGGMAGNNSCGSRSIAYGNMVHNVIGAQAWLASGELLSFGPEASLTGRSAEIAAAVRALAEQHRAEIEARWPKVLRRVGGYNLDIFCNQNERPYTADGQANLAHLLVGSEGTLAFTKSLTLQLAELPRGRVLGIVNFPDFRRAMDSAQHIVKLGPTAVELVDRIMIGLALTNPAFELTMKSALVGSEVPAAILLVEFCGSDRAALAAKLADLAALMGELGLPGSVVAMPEEPRQKALWEVRKAGLNIMMSLKGDGKPVSFIEDCAVPLPHLADYTDALTECFERHGTHGTWYAHASVGTLHVRPILDMRRGGPDGGVAKMRAIAEEASALVRRFKGAYSGEHGDGLSRGEWIEWQFGPALTGALREIKRHFDPDRLFCPGRIIDAPKMDDGRLFRYPPPEAPQPYRRIPIAPVLDWQAWNVQNDARTEAVSAPGSGGDVTGGFAAAVEMCNNNGHCRKFDAGTMCPSWRVTRDEQHSTRGRANTLRLAVSGQLGPEALTGVAVREALELCVGCKGCRRECPTGIDMARLKIEVTAQSKAREGYSLKDRLLGYLPAYARHAARWPWLFNLRETLPGARWLGEKLMGVAASRSMPLWRADTFWSRPKAEALVSADKARALAITGHRVVALFVDTFDGCFETENAAAAVTVLRAAGYAVHVPRPANETDGHLCCGRTLLAAGMVTEAKASLTTLLDALLPLAEAGVPIVGLEPSCLLTLRDEALALGLGEKAEKVAAAALLFEEFAAREAKAGHFRLKLKKATQPILVHGHCHQKAFAAADAVLDVLRLIPGAEVSLIESSCCGMAGSFGYEAEHQEVSLQMAELSLLPAVRAAPGAIVVADGTSCRHQIAHGATREALHAVRVLEQHLV